MAWLYELDSYFLLANIKDHQKVATVKMGLRGDAGTFAYYLVVSNKGVPLSWHDFRVEFINKYEKSEIRGLLLRQKLDVVDTMAQIEWQNTAKNFESLKPKYTTWHSSIVSKHLSAKSILLRRLRTSSTRKPCRKGEWSSSISWHDNGQRTIESPETPATAEAVTILATVVGYSNSAKPSPPAPRRRHLPLRPRKKWTEKMTSIISSRKISTRWNSCK